MRLLRHQLKWEQRLFWRSRESAVFVFLFPILLFALLTAVYNGRLDGRPAAWVLLAGMIGYGAANTAFSGLAITLVTRRELGILKRIRAWPPASGGRTNTVSERFISRASFCMVSSSTSRPSVKTASWLPASGTSVNTSATT
jgi:hypothetical protein